MKYRGSIVLRAGFSAALGVIGLVPLAQATTPAAVDEVVSNPQAAWEHFLDRSDFDDTKPAYDLLGTLGYRHDSVDAAACAAHAQELRDATIKVPVGIAIRRAAMLCAEATGDEAGAERELEALAALSKLALTGGEGVWEKPIRVLRPNDIYSLLAGSGLQYRYEYYRELSAGRYFPIVVAAWDAEAKVERHLEFDYMESVYRLSKKDDLAGFPIRRRWLTEAVVAEQAKGNEVAAVDIKALQAASQTADMKIKAAKLRPAAELGGMQSLRAWLLLCNREPAAGCADGLIDALLPLAEAQQALPMTLLAYAYGEGIGLPRDEQASAELLDAANRRWHRDGATSEYAALWSAAHPDAAWPAALQARLTQAVARGSAEAEALLVMRKVLDKGKPALSDGEIAFLSDPAHNQMGMGYGVLADYHDGREHKAEAATWLERAALAGSPAAQSRHGAELFDRNTNPATTAEGRRLMEQSAQGGYAEGMRQMAYLSRTQSKWADAEAWLLDASAGGNIDAILDISELREWQRPGVRANRENAIATYRALSDENDVAEARRRLAAMAIDGRGMKKDVRQAKQWLLRDAERGDHASEKMLGSAYLRGMLGAVDEKEGQRWMGKAIAANDADAYVEYGAWLYYFKNTPDSRLQAIDLWQKGEAADNRVARNNLAWAWCTTEDARIFDATRGVAMARKIQSSAAVPAGVLDTVAACHAAAGDFDQAIAVQRQAMDMLGDVETEEQATKKEFDSRLALYRDKKRYVEIISKR